jgi:hypothetical protein
MGRPLKIKKSTTKDIGFNDLGSLANPVYPATLNTDQFLGVVGGANASVATSSYPVVKCQVFIAGESTEEAGYIIRQKGTTKYLVYGTSSQATGVCVLANEATGSLTEGNMNIAMFNGDSTDILISKLSNKWALDYSTPPVRYVINFFTDEGTEIKSGTAGATNALAIAENYTS